LFGFLFTCVSLKGLDIPPVGDLALLPLFLEFLLIHGLDLFEVFLEQLLAIIYMLPFQLA
jgi:hypothetical protein